MHNTVENFLEFPKCLAPTTDDFKLSKIVQPIAITNSHIH